MKQPVLSICIPTWNRWYSLQHCLNSIIEQDEFKSWDVEIVISDNASTDETEVEIWKLCEKYGEIRYFRNEVNIWGMLNLNKAYSLWVWKYLWCLSSHTKINKMSLRRIIALLKKYEPCLLLNLLWDELGFSVYKTNSFLQNYDICLFDNMVDYFSYLWDQFVYDKWSFESTNNLFSNLWCSIINKSYYDFIKQDIVIDKGIEFFNCYSFIHLYIAYYNWWNKKIVLNLLPSFSWVDLRGDEEQKEMKTSWDRKDKVYMQDAHNFTKYVRAKYFCNVNFLIFLKKFDKFRTKLYIINNLPFINFVKKCFSKEMRAKIRSFIGNK